MKNRISFIEFERKLDLRKINFLLSDKEEGPNWTKSKTKKIEKYYKQFLYLSYLYPQDVIVPTKEVDTYWHHHIIDTEKYYEDCLGTIGMVLHHYPYLGTKNKKDKLLLTSLFEKTNLLYKKHFGIHLTSVFNNSTACGGGGGKCGGGGGGGRRIKKLRDRIKLLQPL